jgi:hypothetical protein
MRFNLVPKAEQEQDRGAWYVVEGRVEEKLNQKLEALIFFTLKTDSYFCFSQNYLAKRQMFL